MSDSTDGPTNTAMLDTGEKVEFRLQSETEFEGRKSLKHIKHIEYLGEGVHYSCGKCKLNSKEKAHFFTW